MPERAAGLRLATRGSALALAQARLVAGMLEKAEPGLIVELVTVRTSGDERPAGPDNEERVSPTPAQAGDKSRFVKEIEEALLRREADLAVHSAKDVPGELPEGLAIVGVPARADARDAICGASSIAALPSGARVGTSSLRRRAQLLAAREDLEVGELRGNVDTRLRRLAAGDFDAVVLAAAGLARLGRPEGEPIALGEMTPAPGQGCLALEARADDAHAAELAARLTDHAALLRLTAERTVTAALEASCQTPIGVHAELSDEGSRLALESFVGLPDGGAWIRDRVEGDAATPSEVGSMAATRLLSAGAAELLGQAEKSSPFADRSRG
ncbi:MAG: hydroxymethylbilane synthase [Thermoleophilaceae bacterium]